MTVQTDGEGFMTDSTIADSSSVVSVQSSVSTRSSRSGLTRQGNLTATVKCYYYLLESTYFIQHMMMHTYTFTDKTCHRWDCRLFHHDVFLMFLSCLCLPRVNIQALESWEKVRKDQVEEKTQEDCRGNPTACSERTGYAANHNLQNTCIYTFLFQLYVLHFKWYQRWLCYCRAIHLYCLDSHFWPNSPLSVLFNQHLLYFS